MKFARTSVLLISAIAITFPTHSFASRKAKRQKTAVEQPQHKEPTYSTVDSRSISRYIQNFKVSVNQSTGEVTFIGLVPKELKNKLRIEIRDLDTARAKEGETPVYPISIGIEDSTRSSFDPNITANCTRNNSIEVTDIISISSNSQSVVVKDGKVFLTKTGQLAIRSEDLTRSQNDPEAIKDNPIAGASFKDANTQTAETLAENSAKAKVLCDFAKTGDIEAINQLKDLNFDSKKLEEYEKIAYQKELDELRVKLSQATTLSEVDKSIEAINSFGLQSEHSIIKSDIADALVQAVARLEELAPIDGKQDKFENQKFKLAEKALKYATKLDPKNEDVRIAYDTIRLEHAKWAASTGDASLYRSAISGFNAGYADIARMMRKTDNAEAQALFAEYQAQVNYKMPPQSQWLYYLGVNPYTLVYTIDYNYLSAASKKLDDQYKAYQQNQQSVQSVIGGQQQPGQPANSTIFNSGIQTPLSF